MIHAKSLTPESFIMKGNFLLMEKQKSKAVNQGVVGGLLAELVFY
jgi:hypothetical protein